MTENEVKIELTDIVKDSFNRINNICIAINELINENFEKLTYKEECQADLVHALKLFSNIYFTFLDKFSQEVNQETFTYILNEELKKFIENFKKMKEKKS